MCLLIEVLVRYCTVCSCGIDQATGTWNVVVLHAGK